MGTLRAEVKAGNAELRREIKESNATLRADFGALQAEFGSLNRTIIQLCGALLVTIVGGLVVAAASVLLANL